MDGQVLPKAMWILPRPTVGKAMWTVLKQNSFFQLLEHKQVRSWLWSGVMALSNKIASSDVSSYQPSMYRIVLQDEMMSAIAVADERADIESYWEWIEKKLLPDLSKEDSDRSQMLLFLNDKFTAKAEDVELMQEIDDAQFHKLFDFPEETLFVWYWCSLWQGIYRPGYMYLTDNLICFSSKLSNKIVIPFKDICNIKRESGMAFLDAVVICTSDELEFYFGGLVDVESTFQNIEQLWNMAMDKVLRSVSKQAPGEKLLSTPRNIDSTDLGEDATKSQTKKLLKERRLSQGFNLIFGLPAEENLEEHFVCSLFSNQEYFKGSMFVSTNFICFQCLGVVSIEIVLPMIDVTGVSKNNPYKSALTMITTQSYRFVFSLVGIDNVGERMEKIHKMWSTHVRMREIGQEIPEMFKKGGSIVRLGDKLMLNPHEFGTNYEASEVQSRNLWEQYFAANGRGLSMMKTNVYRSLLRTGVPNTLRAELWQISCGSCYRQLVNPGYYQKMLADVQGKTTSVTEEIERDLHRSFPEHEYFQSEEGVNALRNVLVVYAFRNPSIGYCQSMNIVCALLLLFMPEENVFWMMCAIVEHLVPEYYNEELFGSLVDQHIFEVLIGKYLPRIKDHLEDMGIPLAVVTLPWLLCFYIGYVPMEAALRTLDAFFHEGPDVLFATGLAIFNLSEPALLHASDNDQIVPMMRRAHYTVHDLVPLAVSYENTIKDEIRHLRLRAKYELVTRMEGSYRKKVIKTVEGSAPRFSQPELERLYDAFQRQLSVSTDTKGGGFFLDWRGYYRVFQKFVPWWISSDTMMSNVWEKYRGPRGLSFEAFIRILDALRKGDMVERSLFCFELFAQIKRPELQIIVSAIAALYGRKVVNSVDFALMIYEKCLLSEDSTITFAQFKEVALDTDLMETSFNLMPQVVHRKADMINPPAPPSKYDRIDIELELE